MDKTIDTAIFINISYSQEKEATTKPTTTETTKVSAKTNPNNFLTLYPGVFTEKGVGIECAR
jgi:hypothetical protein